MLPRVWCLCTAHLAQGWFYLRVNTASDNGVQQQVCHCCGAGAMGTTQADLAPEPESAISPQPGCDSATLGELLSQLLYHIVLLNTWM